ncbi:hypothetical protein HD554DRAFT_1504176 [Boletus coccyginus]|nr:hypothetical protein HD554DRAFT_1504176 [Boletus coccyginus]
MWTEHRNPEGRTYWFNTATRESVWEKPDDLKSPFERALTQTKWKEYFSGGRKYYYNTESKESKWDMPDELLLLLEKVEKEAQGSQLVLASSVPAASPTAAQNSIAPPTGTPATPTSTTFANGTNGTVALPGSALPFSSGSILPARPNLPDDPVIPHNGFVTLEEGEKAFMHLLRKAGVDGDWSWDQTMRAIITDPLYKALNTLAEKKAAWQKFTDGLRAKEEEERETRLSKLRPAIRNMLRGNPNVFHYTTFTTADKLFSQHPIWQQAKIEAERKLIFEAYVGELKQREVQETRAARSRSISKIVILFKELGVDVLTRWRKAHEMVVESEEWMSDEELRRLPTLDILLAFEDYSRVKEREFEEQTRLTQVKKIRSERKAREAFKILLQELINAGKIKARSKWRQVYPTFASDERYLNLLGKPGSNPLELFWDVVDQLDQRLDAKIAAAEECIRRVEVPNASPEDAAKVAIVIAQSTLEEFVKRVRRDPESGGKLNEEDLREVFRCLHDQAVKKQQDEKRRHERRQRHLQDDLRYALKKLSDPIDISMPYDAVVPFIEHLAEYKAIEDEESRRAAFARFVKRQKERLREAASEDGASTTSRKRKEPPRDGDRDRDRERDRERERERERERDRDRERDRESYRDKGRDYERDRDRERDKDRGDRDRDRDRDRDTRSSRHHHRADDHDTHSRDHGHLERDKDRDRDYRSSKHPRDERDGKDERRRPRRSSRDHAYGRGYDEVPPYGNEDEAERAREKRERSKDVGRDLSKHEDRGYAERAEKRARYDPEVDSREHKGDRSRRAETPEEGEI